MLLPKASLKIGFSDEGFYNNFAPLLDESMNDQVDFSDELSSDNSSDVVSQFIDQYTKD